MGHIFESEVEFAGEFVEAIELLDDIHIAVGGVFEVHYGYIGCCLETILAIEANKFPLDQKNNKLTKRYSHNNKSQ